MPRSKGTFINLRLLVRISKAKFLKEKGCKRWLLVLWKHKTDVTRYGSKSTATWIGAQVIDLYDNPVLMIDCGLMML